MDVAAFAIVVPKLAALLICPLVSLMEEETLVTGLPAAPVAWSIRWELTLIEITDASMPG